MRIVFEVKLSQVNWVWFEVLVQIEQSCQVLELPKGSKSYLLLEGGVVTVRAIQQGWHRVAVCRGSLSAAFTLASQGSACTSALGFFSVGHSFKR